MAPSLTKGALEPVGIEDVTPSPSLSKDRTKNTLGCFVGFDADKPRSHHVVTLGKLQNIKFMSIFRFKVWWTTHWTGSYGSDLEHETLFVLLDKSAVGRPYVLLLPILEGPFRASLQPGTHDGVDMCIESGSTHVRGSSFRSCVYMHIGEDPYQLVKEAMRVIRVHLGTFKLLEEKCSPPIVDKFGWCTWDAFYLKVHPQGVWEGVQGLVDGGVPPGLVLIDDGWQSISHDEDDPTNGQEGMNRTAAGEQMPCRLIKFEENYKFRDYESPRVHDKGMGAFVRDLKEEFESVDQVYVWHALCGYWGGIRPNLSGMPDSTVVVPKLSPGLEMTMEDLAVDKIVRNGVGLVPPEMVDRMYEGLHSHLEKVGIDGVKVDVIHLLEMVGEDYGGRVELAKAYYKALTASLRKHFNGNGVIASMEHCNDFMYLGTEAISLGRVMIFGALTHLGTQMAPSGFRAVTWCIVPTTVCGWATLSTLTGTCSSLPTQVPHFHAASRAISGGPIYVSDSVGKHDFDLLRRLVLPDGSILRCQYYALPTKDCLFEDPLHDGKTMLKIWNLNKFTGVLGTFNCQGGGWCPETRRNKSVSECSCTVTCFVSPNDIEWNTERNPISTKGVNTFAVYFFHQKKLNLLKPSQTLEISLQPFDYELLTVSPVKNLPSKSVQFAPIGLVNMLNSGGAIQSLVCDDYENSVRVGIRGSGEMKAFASDRPVSCQINGVDVDFGYDDERVVTVQLAVKCVYLNKERKLCVSVYFLFSVHVVVVSIAKFLLRMTSDFIDQLFMLYTSP
ncbi:raffinose synthase family protein [Actinidia rufa]|uniref:Raffinose synthase family protein n=1 Tax=Actinidia rufa TaxID=165716 RepID=A0A7J0GMJ1_9ERIC|nr:raffinose synthase family protein [Actinidia rufa]